MYVGRPNPQVIPAQAAIYASKANAFGCEMLDGRWGTQNRSWRLTAANHRAIPAS